MMFTGGVLDGWDFDDPDKDRPTWPPVGTRALVIQDKMHALFFSATWVVEATVDDEIIAASPESNKPHSEEFIKGWARDTIKEKYVRLRELGVDADACYVLFGGDIEDLG